MIIWVTGRSNSINKKETKECVSFFAHELMSNRLCSNLYIEVIYNKRLYEKDKCVGVVDSLDYYRPRDFIIEIDSNLNYESTLRALAHEMIHVKQYARGELRDYAKSKKIRWKDEIIESRAYWSMPWEKEAYGKEKKLVKNYLKFKL